MTPEQRAAYQNSRVACALLEAAGMHWQNQAALQNGGGVKYHKEHFDALMEKYGVNLSTRAWVFL